MKRFNKIVNGYKNLVKSKLGVSSKKDEEVFIARRTICNACPHKSALDTCMKCNCPLAVKTRSLDVENNCPEKYW